MRIRISLALIFVVLYTCLLSGCGEDPVVTTPAAGDNTGASTAAGSTEVSFPTGPSVDLPELTDPDYYGLDLSVVDGWAVNHSATTSGIIVEDGYYYVDEGFLRYADLNSGVSVFLCSKVTCDHRDESVCEAAVPFETKLFFWNNNLYYFEQNAEGLQLLMRRNSVGMEKAVVATLGEKLLEKDRSLSVEQCIMADGWLYYVVNIQKILRDENGTTVTNGESVLCRVDMTKGTEEVLTMFDGGALLLVTARSDAAIYLTYHFPELELGEDGSPEYPDGYYEQLPYFPANLMRWDASAGECTTLLESTYSVLYAVKFYGGRAVFITRDYDHRYAYDVKTGEIEALAPIHGTIINESYMLHYDAEGTHEKWFIKNMQTGELFSIELPTSTIYRVYNRSDKWLILKANGLYYIPMSAIGDGIQREDATPIPD